LGLFETVANHPSREFLIALIKAFSDDPEAVRPFFEDIDQDLIDQSRFLSTLILDWRVALGDIDAAVNHLNRGRIYLNPGLSFPKKSLRFDPLLDSLRDDPRYWAFIDTLDLPPLPPGHPLYAKEQAWKIKQAAAEMIRERGLVDLKDSRFDLLRDNPQFQAIVEELQSTEDSRQEEDY
jgi:hypothetical protein